MKPLPSLLAAALLLAPLAAFAQSTTEGSGGGAESPSAVPQSGQTGTKPDGIGTTGSAGPQQGQTEKGTSQNAGNQADASTQPFMATGFDLNGPPTQFPPTKTPE